MTLKTEAGAHATKPVDAREATLRREEVARLNSVCSARPGIQEACQERSRAIDKSSDLVLLGVKWLARYLRGQLRRQLAYTRVSYLRLDWSYRLRLC